MMPMNDQAHGTGVITMFATAQSVSFVYFLVTIETRQDLLFMDISGTPVLLDGAKPGNVDD